jgi:hypothetical protein
MGVLFLKLMEISQSLGIAFLYWVALIPYAIMMEFSNPFHIKIGLMNWIEYGFREYRPWLCT